MYFGDVGYYEWRLFWSEFMGTIMQDKAIRMLAGRAKLSILRKGYPVPFNSVPFNSSGVYNRASIFYWMAYFVG